MNVGREWRWMGKAWATYEVKKVKEEQVNIETDEVVAESFNIGTVPTVVLVHRGYELWRQIGDLTVDQLQLVLSEF